MTPPSDAADPEGAVTPPSDAAAPKGAVTPPSDAAAAPQGAAADDATPRPGDLWLHAGRVGRPHGLDGSFYVLRPRLALLTEGRELTIDRGGPRVRIERRAGTDARPIVRLAGAGSRDDAEALRGRDLFVPRDQAPPLDEDEWWPEELQRCQVVDGSRDVGCVRELRSLPSCDVLVVARTGGDELLVPLIRDAVRSVDVDARRIDIDLAFLGEEGPGDD